MTLDFDPVLIISSENNPVVIVYLGLALDLVVFPMSVYFVAISIALW